MTLTCARNALWTKSLYWLIPGILPCFLLSQCRGAFVAVAGAGFIWLYQRAKLPAVALGILAIAAIVLSGSTGSIHDRWTMWTDVLPHLTIMGHGLGSFFTLYPTYASFDTLYLRPEHLHNDWLEYGFETGIIGMSALAGVLWFSRNLVLAVLVIEGAFGFPTHMAATAVLGGLVMGHAVRSRTDLRNLFTDCRDGIRGWYANVLTCAGHFPAPVR